MAVETRYVVVRNGGEEVMTFADKKAADDYDRMLDMAEDITVLLDSAAEMELDSDLKDELSIFLAQNREELLYALRAKKRPAPKPEKDVADAAEEEPEPEAEPEPEKPAPAAKARKTRSRK